MDQARCRLGPIVTRKRRSATKLEPPSAPRLHVDPRHADVPHRPRDRDDSCADLLAHLPGALERDARVHAYVCSNSGLEHILF